MNATSGITPFGKSIKYRLIDLEKQQNWLIEQVKGKTGLYFDSSYLYKVMIGVNNSPTIIGAICEILGIDPPKKEDKA